MDNKAITYSEVLTSTLKKIMLIEIRAKRLIAQRVKARKREKPVETERKGDTETKEQTNNFPLQKERKTCRSKILSESSAVDSTCVTECSWWQQWWREWRHRWVWEQSQEFCTRILAFCLLKRMRRLNVIQTHLSCLGEWRCSRYKPAKNNLCVWALLTKQV